MKNHNIVNPIGRRIGNHLYNEIRGPLIGAYYNELSSEIHEMLYLQLCRLVKDQTPEEVE